MKEISELNEEGRLLHVESTVLSEKIGNPSYDKVGDTCNFVHRLSDYREWLSSFVKCVTRLRRVSATHVLIIMISTEAEVICNASQVFTLFWIARHEGSQNC